MQHKIPDKHRFLPLSFTRVLSTAFMMAFIAGFVDVFGFVQLNKLFTAHITGNIVIAISEIISHTPGVTAKLIALPVFIVIAMIATVLIEYFGKNRPLLTLLLIAEACLLTVFMLMGNIVIPSGNVESWQYILTGMIAVSAMAIHNTLLRTYMTALPPCTVMTGNFSQIIVDMTSYLFGQKLVYPVENVLNSISGIKKFGNVLIAFCLGGLVAALGIVTMDSGCYPSASYC